MDLNNIEEIQTTEEIPKTPEKQLKLRHGIFLMIFVAADIVLLGSLVSMILGIRGFYGTVMGEVLMLIGALLTVLIAGAKFKPVFQFRKPEWRKIFGTIILWIGTYLLTMMVASFMEYLAPVEMAGASEGLQQGILSVSMLPALLIVSLSPAICEEMVFRGVLFNCIWNKTHRKWMTIIVVGIVFGVCHGSFWRFVPTCLLGIMMGYILFETNNMFYNMLFHGINNAFPILMMFAAGLAGEDISSQMDMIVDNPDAYRMMLLPGIGLYIMLGAVGLLALRVGKNMICHVDRSVPKEVRVARQREEKKLVFLCFWIMIVIGAIVIGVGYAMGSPMVETTSMIW